MAFPRAAEARAHGCREERPSGNEPPTVCQRRRRSMIAHTPALARPRPKTSGSVRSSDDGGELPEPPVGHPYPCPCCGYLVFDAGPGSYDICPLCGWEDDVSQLRFANTHGANRISLRNAQLAVTIPAVVPYERDPEWRPIAAADVEEPSHGIEYGNTYPGDYTHLYYWRPNYWKREPRSGSPGSA